MLFRQVWLKHPGGLQVAGAVTAPISGIVQRWLKTSGETVSEGETLAVMEAMKMEVPGTCRPQRSAVNPDCCRRKLPAGWCVG
ncbi:acetyl-CoA carboxylase biotin carboxyl carrier protein subunit [Enterobacter hormaechei]